MKRPKVSIPFKYHYKQEKTNDICKEMAATQSMMVSQKDYRQKSHCTECKLW